MATRLIMAKDVTSGQINVSTFGSKLFRNYVNLKLRKKHMRGIKLTIFLASLHWLTPPTKNYFDLHRCPQKCLDHSQLHLHTFWVPKCFQHSLKNVQNTAEISNKKFVSGIYPMDKSEVNLMLANSSSSELLTLNCFIISLFPLCLACVIWNRYLHIFACVATRTSCDFDNTTLKVRAVLLIL